MVRQHPPEAHARAEASLWLARLQEDARREETLAGLRQWLADDILHRQAFEKASNLWEMLGGVSPALLEEEEKPAPRLQQLATVMASLFLAAFFLLTGPDVRPQYLATAIGGQRDVALTDGTRVTLNTDSAIQVLYSGAERRIRLLKGEALFDVVHERGRPFYVRYPKGLVRDIGTTFLVRSTPDEASVTLIEGEVAVRQEDGPGWASSETFLKPGERYRTDARQKPVIDRPSLASLTAWKEGRAIFDTVSIREAAAEMNRYTLHTRIAVAPEVGDLPLSGVFSTARPYAFAIAVASIYDLELGERGGTLELSPKKSS